MKHNKLKLMLFAILIAACSSLQANQLTPTQQKALEKQVAHGTANFDTHAQLLKNDLGKLEKNHQELNQKQEELAKKFQHFWDQDTHSTKEYKTYQQQFSQLQALTKKKEETTKAINDYSFFHKMEHENITLKDPELAHVFQKLKENANQLKMLQDKEQQLLKKKTLLKKRLENQINQNQVEQTKLKDDIEKKKQIVNDRTLPLITKQPDEGPENLRTFKSIPTQSHEDTKKTDTIDPELSTN